MNKKFLYTTIIIIGFTTAYMQHSSIAPLLSQIALEYGIENNDALLNLAVSIEYPSVIIASILGETIEHKRGLKTLYSLDLILMSLGLLTNLLAVNYGIFLLGRIIYGFGFGFGIPFIGSAIAQLYSGRQQDLMNTMNGLFPYIAALIAYAIMVPLSYWLASWKFSLSVWSAVFCTLFLLWMLVIRRTDLGETLEGNHTPFNIHTYIEVWRRREIRLVAIVYMCDLICYSFVGAVLPTLLHEASALSSATSSAIAAVVFPGIGILGVLAGGYIITYFSKKRPNLVYGSGVKVLGLTFILPLSLLFDSFAMLLVAVALFGFGGGMLMPSIYSIPMDLPKMDPKSVGISFALMSSCAYICGFIAPSCGGFITDLFVATGFEHVLSVQYSLIILSISNVIALIAALLLPETGKRKDHIPA